MTTVIHVAAALDPSTQTQRCERCGFLLAEPYVFRWEDWEYEMEVAIDPTFQREVVRHPLRVFAAGDLVESSRYGLCLVLDVKAAPTCAANAKEAA